ncbi:MAG: chemotaxis protein CheB [Gemmatimonadales bacterium]
MPTHDIVVIGASARGIDAVRRLLATLSADFPGALFIAQHLHPQSPWTLPRSLQSVTKLHVHTAEEGMEIEPGHVYVAPPDRHVVLTPDHLHVTRGPEERRHRPLVDPLFRSAAYNFGRRVVAVVLTGTIDNGVSGLWAVQTCGGITIVQDSAEAPYSEVPTGSRKMLDVDYRLRLDDIWSTLDRLARESVNGAVPVPAPAPTRDGRDEDMSAALASALRVLEENGTAARRLRDRLSERVPALARLYEAQAMDTEEQATLIRRVLRARAKA